MGGAVMFDDLLRHPWFTGIALAGVAAFFLFIYYYFKDKDEEMNLQYAMVDLLYRIYEKVS